MILELRKNNRITLFLIILAVISTLSCGNIFPKTPRPAVVKGFIDLRGWNFIKGGAIPLDGEWEFCRGRLLEPSDFAGDTARKDCSYIAVPGTWEGSTADGAVLSETNQATYRLRVNLADDAPKTVSLIRIYSAYRLWINGRLEDQAGSVGRSPKTEESYVFVHNVRSATFTPVQGVNEIVLQVANYQHGSGGIGSSVRLEDAGSASAVKFRQYTSDMIIFGLLVFAFIYNIILFYFQRKDVTALYLSIICLFVALNTINHQFPLLSGRFAFPGNPYFANYFTVIGIFVGFVMIIRSLFPDEFPIHAVRIFLAPSALSVVLLFFLGFRMAELMMRYYTASILLLIVYIMYVFYKAIRNRREDVWLFLAGFIPIFIGITNDVLYAMWIINTTHIGQYGQVILCIFTTIVISRRFARALRSVEKLSADLTEKNIALQKLDRMKDQFLATTSHELRTPLHGMIGLSESMMDAAGRGLSPEDRENLSLIASSGHRLANMVNDLLDMAKIQDEGLNLNPRPVDLRFLCDMVVRISLPLAGKKPLEIKNSISPDTPRVHADEERIRQVLSNLVGNAVKFTNKGVIEISARVIARDEEGADPGAGEFIEVRVSDTGIGVPEEYKDAIFEAYRQVDGGDTRTFAGTGLGLAIAKQIVERHGGTIRLESGRGGGSVFTFTLPVSTDTVLDATEDVLIESMYDEGPGESPQREGGVPVESPEIAFEGNPVLLAVDDDPVNVRIIRNYFETKGCVVKTAADGMGALDIIEGDDTIDLVLLDIMMPVMSGYEVCRRIRERRAPEELPVIMLTAKNMMADIDAAFEAGANDYIVKPFRIRELLARVGTMLKLRNVRRSAAGGLTIRDRNRAYSVRFADITHISSHSKNVVIHTNEGEIELPVLLKEIIDRLPPDMFVRIHKSHIINIGHVHSLTHVLSGRYRVRLKDDDDTELPVGSAYLEDFRKKLQH